MRIARLDPLRAVTDAQQTHMSLRPAPIPLHGRDAGPRGRCSKCPVPRPASAGNQRGRILVFAPHPHPCLPACDLQRAPFRDSTVSSLNSLRPAQARGPEDDFARATHAVPDWLHDGLPPEEVGIRLREASPTFRASASPADVPKPGSSLNYLPATCARPRVPVRVLRGRAHPLSASPPTPAPSKPELRVSSAGSTTGWLDLRPATQQPPMSAVPPIDPATSGQARRPDKHVALATHTAPDFHQAEVHLRSGGWGTGWHDSRPATHQSPMSAVAPLGCATPGLPCRPGDRSASHLIQCLTARTPSVHHTQQRPAIRSRATLNVLTSTQQGVHPHAAATPLHAGACIRPLLGRTRSMHQQLRLPVRCTGSVHAAVGTASTRKAPK
jgi:hypothetical protein